MYPTCLYYCSYSADGMPIIRFQQKIVAVQLPLNLVLTYEENMHTERVL